MQRPLEEICRTGDLHHPAKIEHDDAVRDVAHHRQIVRDEQVGQVQLLLQVDQQVDDLRLDVDVERGDRLVGDDELRRDRQRTRDGDALALAAGEFVRILAQRGRERPTSDSNSSTRRRGRGLVGREPVEAERLGQDVEPPSCAG